MLTAKEKAKDARLRRELHTTLAQYNIIYAYQDGRCAMCKRPSTDFKNGLALDHDHKTGLVRGLLCHMCNRMLGKFRDQDELLVAGGAYVTTPPAVKALGFGIYTALGRLGTKVRKLRLAKLKGANGNKAKGQ